MNKSASAVLMNNSDSSLLESAPSLKRSKSSDSVKSMEACSSSILNSMKKTYIVKLLSSSGNDKDLTLLVNSNTSEQNSDLEQFEISLPQCIDNMENSCQFSNNELSADIHSVDKNIKQSAGILHPITNLNNTSTAENSESHCAAVVPVSTLVFFDLETTGLANEIGKSNVQITEISMIAMSRKEFEKSCNHDLKDIRMIQKLSLCIKPRAMVSYGAAKVTGLDNMKLSDQTTFDENAAVSIVSFLSHLPQPVCLLAHNGSLFDFPLLKAELLRLSYNLPSNILVADTLKAFRQLGIPVYPKEKICKSVKYTKGGQVSYSLENLHLYLFKKKPLGSHSSEGDCIALAKVCHKMKDLLLHWIDENCSMFDLTQPMW